jgi:hypothetical protein
MHRCNPDRCSGSEPGQRSFSRTPSGGLFWLFWGAKKGTFLGFGQKKSAPPAARQNSDEVVCFDGLFVSLSPLTPCGRGAGGEGFAWSTRGRNDRAREGGLFWGAPVRPKKGSIRSHGRTQKMFRPPPWRPEKLFPPPRGGLRIPHKIFRRTPKKLRIGIPELR